MPLKDLLLLSDEGSVCHPSNSVTGTPAILMGRWSVRGEVMEELGEHDWAFKNDGTRSLWSRQAESADRAVAGRLNMLTRSPPLGTAHEDDGQ